MVLSFGLCIVLMDSPCITRLQLSREQGVAESKMALLTLYIPKNLSLPSVRGGPTVASRSSNGVFSGCSGWTPFFFTGYEVLEGMGAFSMSQRMYQDPSR